jgi:S-adenosylmethionine/arginine decarboxylase-like enzyme
MKPFGYSYLLDMYNVKPGAADDLELHYRFLEELVDRLHMTRMAQPIVMHGPTKDMLDIYPDKLGVSGWVPLIESGIQIHSIEPTHFITLDVYSCNAIITGEVLEYAREMFGFTDYEDTFIVRGSNYGFRS